MGREFVVIEAGAAIDAIGEEIAARLGTTAERAIGRPFAEVFAAPEWGGLVAAVQRLLAGAEQEASGTGGAPGGDFAWMASRLWRGQDRWAVVVMLSEAAATVPEAAADLESYRATFEHAIEGIFRTTLDGHYLEANQALARIYGFESPAELIAALRDLNTQLYVKEGRREDFVQAMQTQGYVSDFESEVYRADGSRIWIVEFARTVLDREGTPIYFEGSVVDVSARYHAAEALRESERKFRSLVENLNVVPWEAEVETGALIYVGPQAERMLGYPTDDWFVPDFWTQHIHPEDREWVSNAKEAALTKNARFELEYRFLRKNGEIIWVRDMMSPPWENGGRLFVGGFLLDVTYHHFIEASLRESQSFFEHVVSAAPVIFYLYRLQGEQCLYVAGQALELLGMTKASLSKIEPFFPLALGHPDELEEHRAHFALLADERSNRVFEREYRLRGADGEWVWMRCRESIFERTPDGRPKLVVGVATDNTLRRFAREELTNNEHLFRSLVETTRVVPFEFSYRSRRMIYVGPQAEALFGYPTNRWYTEGFGVSIVHPDDRMRVLVPFGTLEEISGTESDLQGEFRIRKSNGEYLWVRNIVRFGPEERRQGSGRGFLLDIGETKLREAELDLSRKQLRKLVLRSQKVREEERVRIARELHDELGQALMLSRIDLEWIEACVGRSFGAEVPASLSRRIGEMNERMKATVDTLRRIYTNLRPPILDEVGLPAAIEWQAHEFSRRIGIRCEAVVGEMDPPSEEVATAVFRIFQEVLTNVAKHAAATSVKATLKVEAGRVKLMVRDNGRGFAPKTKTEAKGFGLLGMNERTEALGGTIEITSKPGEGTRIDVELPLAGPHPWSDEG